MRNLYLTDYNYDILDNINAECVTYCGNTLYVATGTHLVEIINGKHNRIANYEQFLKENNRQVSNPVSIFYSEECCKLYTIFLDGDIISFNTVNSLEYIGCFESGVKATEWSPTEEHLALVTGTKSMVLLESDFKVVSEVNLLNDDEIKFASVGWGKEETQFRGKEGKFNKENNKEVRYNYTEDEKVRISWRSDGELFAISCVINNERKLKIFNKEGVLQHTSEKALGLEGPLNWKPDGTLIACSRQLPNKYVICFFEKNGLVHGQFDITDEEPVLEVLWNGESKILCIWKKSSISMYTTQNYHWYLKYTIRRDDVKTLFWDKQNLNTLHVVTNNYFLHYTMSWVVNKSVGMNEADGAWVAVIDGKNLLLTSFKNAIIPPPMSLLKITCNETINCVGFVNFNDAIDFNSNQFFVQLATGLIILYHFNNGVFQAVKEYELDKNSYNVTLIEPFVLVNCKRNNGVTFLCKSLLLDSQMEEIFDTPGKISIIRKHPNQKAILFYTDEKKIKSIGYDEFCEEPQQNWDTPLKLIQYEIRKIENELLVFYLDGTNKFFINNVIIADNVTSFVFHDYFILLTTLQNQLVCWDLKANEELESRSIERGGRLITSVPGITKVILQMPRGNLECVQPRSLSLSLIKTLLNNCSYHRAYTIMRKERINLNLIADHDFNKFISNVDLFIKEINDASWISAFVAELTEDDVTNSMYKKFYKTKEANENHQNKIESVCKVIETAICRCETKDNFCLALISAKVKRNAVDSALFQVQHLRQRETKGERLMISSSNALKHILYLLDMDQLYRHALGTYDLNLVEYIVSKSQKDPKEYLPFLNELHAMEPTYQKFKIEKFLKHFDKALEHLIQCEEQRIECLDFIENHKLYKQALRLLEKDTDRYKEVCSLYANHLTQLKEHEGAGIYFRKASAYDRALHSFKNCNKWEEAISCAQILNIDQKTILYKQLAQNLLNENRFEEASKICLDYLKNIPQAVSALCKGRCFSEAIRIAELHEKRDLIESTIKPSAVELCSFIQEEISSNFKLICEQAARLKIVKENKLKPQNSNEFLYEDDASTCASSTSSRSTTRTRSSKNTRKLERKMYSLKQGSPYEDIALKISLYDIIKSTILLKTTIRNLNIVLIRIDEMEKAKELQQNMEEILKNLDKTTINIWRDDDFLLATHGPQSTSNSIAREYVNPQVQLLAKHPKVMFPPDLQKEIKWTLDFVY